jgi:hypothetical protein
MPRRTWTTPITELPDLSACPPQLKHHALVTNSRGANVVQVVGIQGTVSLSSPFAGPVTSGQRTAIH